MKISKAKLRQIIKEELTVTLKEDWDYEGDDDDDMIDAVQRGEAVAKYYLRQRNQVARQMRGKYDTAFNLATNKSQK
jgi:hypothetical protein